MIKLQNQTLLEEQNLITLIEKQTPDIKFFKEHIHLESIQNIERLLRKKISYLEKLIIFR